MDEQDLDFLLSQGRLSGAQKDRVLIKVLESTAREQRGARFSLAWLAKRRWILGLCGVALALLLYPVVISVERSDQPPSFTAKGSGAVSSAAVEAGCPGGCTLGDNLLFRVSGLEQPAFLAAFAEDTAGRRIWYFPDEGGAQPAVQPAEAPAVLNKGIALGAEHRPGHYQVTLLLTGQQLSRGEILQALAETFPQQVLYKSEQQLEIGP